MIDWGDYNAQRIENIKGQVRITDVLDHYGIKVLTKDREFQFPCPLHGDGQDNSYSARMYPDSESTYCFACHQSRDIVQWIVDAEALSFGKALSYIERAFNVQNIPKPTFDPTDERTRTEVLRMLQKQKEAPTLLDAIHRIDVKLQRHLRTSQKAMQLEPVTRVFYILDNLRHDLKHENVEEEQAKKVLSKLFTQVQEWCSGGVA